MAGVTMERDCYQWAVQFRRLVLRLTWDPWGRYGLHLELVEPAYQIREAAMVRGLLGRSRP